MITQVSSSLYHQLSAVFDDGLATKGDLEPLASLRRNAFARFQETGFPTLKSEDWKYTNLQPLVNKNYLLSDNLPGKNVSIEKASIKGLNPYKLILVNGRFRADLSDTINEQGILIYPIENIHQHKRSLGHFAQYADKTDNPLVALNTALHEGGLVIEIEKNITVERSIQIIHVASSSEAVFNKTRNLYLIGNSAKVEILESFITDDAGLSLNNTVSEIVLEENAHLQHYYLQTASVQSSYLNHTEIHQEKHS